MEFQGGQRNRYENKMRRIVIDVISVSIFVY